VRATFIPLPHGENSLRLRESRTYLLVIIRYSRLLRREEGGGRREEGKKCGHARERRRPSAIEIIARGWRGAACWTFGKNREPMPRPTRYN